MLLRWFYTFLLCVCSPLLLAWMFLRTRRAGGHWDIFGGERYGYYGHDHDQNSPAAAPLVWVHAVSLGETRAATPLIQALLKRNHRVLLTHITATGRAEGARVFAAELASGQLRQAWLPYDFPWAMRRFMRHFKPAIGVLMERELWPNMVWAAKQQRLGLILASARMSASALRSAQRLSLLMRPVYGAIGHTYAQSLTDARRLEQAGARNVSVSGNFKFDLAPEAALVERGQAFGSSLARRVIVIASTREGEDAPFISAIGAQLERWRGREEKNPLFILVPRHPQRFTAAGALLQSAGLSFVRRTKLLELGDASGSALAACADVDVILGDTMGELPWYYGCAQLAIVAGSFAPLGGQNFIEASAVGLPVIVGPHTHNFAQAVALAKEQQALICSPDPASAVRCASDLLDQNAQLNRMAEAARHWVSQHTGAVERVLYGIEAKLAAP